MQNLKKNLSEDSKFSKICTLIGSFFSKYLMFDIKRYRGVISFMTLKNDAKFEKKTDMLFQK